MKLKKYIKTLLAYTGMIFLSIFLALVLRLFILDFYTIPSDSMTPAIEPGDFIVVNKLYFGARFYKNLRFTPGRSPETVRVPGYSPLKHNDVVVFNYPKPGLWDLLEMDPGTFYVKRCIGLPGDTLSIVRGFYTVNGEKGFGNLQDQERLSSYRGTFAPGIYSAFPFDARYNWNIVDFGPLFIPAAGSTLPIDSCNIALYRRLINHETGSRVRTKKGCVYLNDSLITSYTFRKNWYFMGGDKIFNSRDSRYIGLIPEDFIIGKAFLILTSKDPITRDYAWERFFKAIK